MEALSTLHSVLLALWAGVDPGFPWGGGGGGAKDYVHPRPSRARRPNSLTVYSQSPALGVFDPLSICALL